MSPQLMTCMALLPLVVAAPLHKRDTTYTNAVQATSYSQWNLDGSYDRVTNMDNGACEKQNQSYSGPLAPLNDEVSFHFRGPLGLKQFAHYALETGPSKRDLETMAQHRSHRNHSRRYKGNSAHTSTQGATDQKRQAPQCGQPVTAIINGETATFPYNWGPCASTFAATSSVTAATSTEPLAATSTQSPPVTESSMTAPASHSTSTSSSSFSTASTPSPAAGSWQRAAYYSSTSQQSSGLTFLNNLGGQGSGVWDETFGNSLSYASSSGTAAASTPQILSDTILPDVTEISIWSASACGTNGDTSSCGYYRPNTTAYHGFAGDTKLFLMEFSMPYTGSRAWEADMPAIWALNANIPRTEQYGNCSSWGTGGGEWDILEVLESGSNQATTTFHGSNNKGYEFPEYFERPGDGTIKVAVMFDGSSQSGSIKILDDGTDFEEALDQDTVSGWLSSGDGSLKAGSGKAAGSGDTATVNLAQYMDA